MASTSSFSSSASSIGDMTESFLEAMAEGVTVGSNSSSKLDYLDSLGSKGTRDRGDSEYPEPSVAPPQSPEGGQYSYTTVVNSGDTELGSNVQQTILEERREIRQRQVLFIIAVHLMLLTIVDFSLQISLIHCGLYCPSPTLLHRFELGVVVLFPCSALLFLRLASCCRNSGSAVILMSSYSILFALFFFAVCDLMFGPTKAHREIAFILFTLTICFVLFSLYVYSKNSPKCLYLAFAILTLTVVSTLGLLLAFPDVLEQLPHKLEAIMAPNREPITTSIWVSYGTALIFAIAAVSLTTLIFTALRGFIFHGNHTSLEDGACFTAVEALLRMEMFFVVWPYEVMFKLGRLCLPSPAWIHSAQNTNISPATQIL